MKVVIDIPENDYKLACNYPDALIACYAHYIKAGLPLPKKHGRLIDADALIDTLEQAIAIMETMLKQLDLEADDGCLMELKAYRDIRDGIKEIDAVIEAEGAEE